MEFNLSEEKQVVELLISKAIGQEYQRGQSVYEEGESPKGLYYVKEGLIGLVKLSVSGTENLLRVFKVGQFFGHRSLFSKENYHANARCLEKSEILFCPSEIVHDVFDKNPRAYFFLARALAKELRRAETRSVIISEGDIMERVASALILFKKLYPEHPWTRTEIANYCASRTPTVIKTLGKLEEMGAIKQEKRSIEILNEGQLLDLLV